MSWELSRRRILRSINEKYLFGRIPILHAVVFLIEMALIARLTARFNTYYEERPRTRTCRPQAALLFLDSLDTTNRCTNVVMTMMVTNAILGGVADTVAQSITAIRTRASRKSVGADKDEFAIEIHELNRKSADFDERDFVTDNKTLPTAFDFERLTRFMAYGFCVAPLQFKWFRFLERAFPITKTSAFGPAMKRVVFDQLVYAPFGVGLFFTVMTVAEGGGRRAIGGKLRDMYVPTLKANYVVWPAVQIVNFRLMPVQFQLPFVSTIGIAWTAYLSLTNASD
ncbi:Mpv17/PMP22, partial [Metarhizium majus ARSEF 297]